MQVPTRGQKTPIEIRARNAVNRVQTRMVIPMMLIAKFQLNPIRDLSGNVQKRQKCVESTNGEPDWRGDKVDPMCRTNLFGERGNN